VRSLTHLPLDKIVERGPVDLAVPEGRNERRDRAFKHGKWSFKSFIHNDLRTAASLSRKIVSCKKSLIAVLALFALLAAPPVQADNPQIVRALQAMQQKQWSLARKLVHETRDPLAHKLYTWMYFREENAESDFTLLAQFIRGHADWPGMDKLREKAERGMPSRLSNAEVNAWFADYPPLTASGLDRYLGALIGTGRKAEAKKVITEWWAEKLTTRDDQKRIYMKYGGLLDTEAHRKRLDTLLFSGQTTNARAIAQVLGPGFPELTEARIGIAEDKPGINALIAKVPRNLQNDPGFLYERLRWRRKNNLDVEAMQILNNAPPPSQIQNPEDWWKERHIIIRRLLERRMYESSYILASEHGQKDGFAFAEAEWLAGWLALRYLNAPNKAAKHFEALFKNVSTPVSKARGAYWMGRTADQLKQAKTAEAWYREAAKYQTVFYGQLAGAELGLGNALPNAQAPDLSSADKAEMNKNDMVRASRLFQAAGMKKEASRFLAQFAESQGTPKAYRFAAEMASDMKQYYDAVKIAKEATNKGLFLTAQSYPVITDKLRNVNIEWALVHSLIRQESMFDTQAQSPVGATGLMQLMPATAKSVATKEGLPYSPTKLTTAEYNIRLGTSYMDELLDRYRGSYPLAIAAYNAGPGRVDGWIKTFGDPRTNNMDLVDWIEMMPIYETRNYVQRVLESVYVYRLRLKGVQKDPAAEIHVAMNGIYSN
jgi:soluble lytic murein transglycosylase